MEPLFRTDGEPLFRTGQCGDCGGTIAYTGPPLTDTWDSFHHYQCSGNDCGHLRRVMMPLGTLVVVSAGGGGASFPYTWVSPWADMSEYPGQVSGGFGEVGGLLISPIDGNGTDQTAALSAINAGDVVSLNTGGSIVQYEVLTFDMWSFPADTSSLPLFVYLGTVRLVSTADMTNVPNGTPVTITLTPGPPIVLELTGLSIASAPYVKPGELAVPLVMSGHFVGPFQPNNLSTVFLGASIPGGEKDMTSQVTAVQRSASPTDIGQIILTLWLDGSLAPGSYTLAVRYFWTKPDWDQGEMTSNALPFTLTP
jgi:hypothetical protein